MVAFILFVNAFNQNLITIAANKCRSFSFHTKQNATKPLKHHLFRTGRCAQNRRTKNRKLFVDEVMNDAMVYGMIGNDYEL